MNKTNKLQASLFRAIPQNQTQTRAERGLQEQPPAPPSHTLPNALAHWRAVARLHQLLQTEFWYLQQSLEMPNEEQIAALGAEAATKAKRWTVDFWDTWKQTKMPSWP